jgi:hypothetical protein
MNGGDFDAARVLGRALRFISRPTSGSVREQGQEFGCGHHLWKEWSRFFLGRSNIWRGNEGSRQSDN